MKVTGAIVTATDSAPGAEEAYQRWLGQTRAPELAADPEVAEVLHYRAPPALQDLRGANPVEAFAPGSSQFLEVCLVTGADPLATAARLAEARASDVPADLAVMIRHREAFELSWAMGRSGVDERDESLPFVAHKGIQLAMGEVADVAMRGVIADWYLTIHAPDALQVDGFMVALRLVSRQNPGRHLVMFLLGDEPDECVRRVREAVPRWRSQGRTPSPGGASKAIVNGPFARLAR